MTERAALVTGASRGIGAAIAARLAREGYGLTVSARQKPGVAAAVQRLEHDGAPVQGVVANMADDDEVIGLAERHEARFGRLDLLVLCAGVGTNHLIGDLPMKMYDLQMAVNLRAPVLLVRECLPLLRRTAKENPKGTRVVALSSLTAVAAEAELGAYGASKAALVSLCETLCVEESAGGVSATAISPGYVDTDMADWVAGELDSGLISPDDIAELVVSLTRLSANAIVPHVTVSRPGARIWRA
jgi:NAD(P)-dependent dehydrogenase (short-subunit alcohol dehydrogenase family)